jgi:outer membrane protein
MKRFTIFIWLSLSVIPITFAQKFGYVDMNYILTQMPEYASAQAEIDKLAAGWEDEIRKRYQEVEKMEATYKAEEVLLTVDMKEDREYEINRKMLELKEYQKQIFGFEGLYFLKKKELIRPVQDIVYIAVERLAKNNRLQIVFDKSGELVMIYTDPIHDYTDYVIDELGVMKEESTN